MQTDYWFIFRNDELLIVSEEDNRGLIKPPLHSKFEKFFTRQYALGNWQQNKIYCAELPPDFALSENITTLPLRKAFDLLGLDWFSFAVKAYSIINWDKNHHYCGRCGELTVHSQANAYERLCSVCHLHFYPRISPSVIVLIYRNNEILMARSPQFLPGIYGLIAGFVEAGETLEEAVHREVHEEVGIQVKNLQYFASQPWPFPDSLMVAFIAEYAGGELLINPHEIEEASWYPINKLPGYPSSKVSIARKLIDHFVATRNNRENQSKG